MELEINNSNKILQFLFDKKITKTKAANILEISRQSFDNKLKYNRWRECELFFLTQKLNDTQSK